MRPTAQPERPVAEALAKRDADDYDSSLLARAGEVAEWPIAAVLKTAEHLSEAAINSQVSNSRKSALPSCLPESLKNYPELARIVEAWPILPEAIKAGILAMVEAITQHAG